MNEKIRNILKYILFNYPYKGELSASRITKILYLVDWKSAIEKNEQLTSAKWYFNHYGPYVDDFIEIASQDDDIEISQESTVFGGKKKLISLSPKFRAPVLLEPDEKKLVDFVIDATKAKNYEDFIKLVYSTYPVITNSKYSQLDLVSLAKDYKDLIEKNKQYSNL